MVERFDKYNRLQILEDLLWGKLKKIRDIRALFRERGRFSPNFAEYIPLYVDVNSAPSGKFMKSNVIVKVNVTAEQQ